VQDKCTRHSIDELEKEDPHVIFLLDFGGAKLREKNRGCYSERNRETSRHLFYQKKSLYFCLLYFSFGK